MANSLLYFYSFPIDTRHIPDTYPTHTPCIRISHEYVVNTPRIVCEYHIGTSIISHPKSPASNVGERTYCLCCRYNSLSLCARGVVRAQMLLDYVVSVVESKLTLVAESGVDFYDNTAQRDADVLYMQKKIATRAIFFITTILPFYEGRRIIAPVP